MNRSRIKIFILAVLLPVIGVAHADVNSDMNNFFNKLGFDSNTSMPQVWQGQAAGYASGGSMFARTSVKNVQLVSLQLPNVNAGCGGIDAYLGSFSFINGEQLQRFAKQIMSNAAGYFFDLALQTTVPEMKQAKDFLQKMASDVNSMNMSSCQAAQGIIGGLWPRTQVSQQKVCQDIAGESNIFADWAASRQGCSVGGQMNSVTDRAGEKDKDRVMRNVNLMWKAMTDRHFFDGNRQLQEFAMSLTGSLIFDNSGNVTPLFPLAGNEDIIKAMMNGGQAQVYACNDASACLKPTVATVTISQDNSLNGQVRQLLTSIQNKAVADEPLSEKEKGFISSTRVPVLQYLVDPLSLGIANSVVYQLSEYISHDILMQYMNEMIQQTRIALAGKNYDEASMEQLQKTLEMTQTVIGQHMSRVQVQQDALQVVDRQMSYMRQQLSSRIMDRYQSNYHYGR